MKKKATPDVLIIGGGIIGCMTAVAVKKRGLDPLIIEKRSYLGSEVAAFNHTFVGCESDDASLRRIPDPFKELFLQHGGNELVVPEGLIRQQLMKIIEAHSIPVLFEAEVVAVSHASKKITGLMIACPAGLAWVPGNAVIDATEQLNVLRMLNDIPHIAAGAAVTHSVFEMEMPGKVDSVIAAVDTALVERIAADNGLTKGSIRLHTTQRADTVVIEYAFAAVSTGAYFETRSMLDAQARNRSVDLAAYLRANIPVFKDARLTHIAHEAHISDSIAGVQSPYKNAVAAPLLPWGFSLKTVADNAAAIQYIIAGLTPLSRTNNDTAEMLTGRGFSVETGSLMMTPYVDSALPVPLHTLAWTPALTPAATFSSDVCVAGIGAGGGMTMLAAAEHGSSVTALEVNREPGGTYTAGRVVGYYEGYKGGVNVFAADEAVIMMKPAMNNPGHGGLSHSNLLTRKAGEHNVRFFTGTRVCGVLRDKNNVTGIIAANEDGLFAVKARVTVDTTGDADLAALAGVPYSIGDARDGMMQSYSMWGTEVYPCPDFKANRFLTDPDIIRPDVYSERLRAVSLGHRDNSPFHISPMFTVREARRIAGEHALTMRAILDNTLYDDVIAVASTSADSHAHTSNDLAKIGTIGAGEPLKVRIPYGCFIPKGLDGMLVAAKAISGERDATCFCRMNADIKNAGYAVGAAAAFAAGAGCNVRDIDMKALQQKLRDNGVLPAWAFTAENRTTDLSKIDDGDLVQLDRILRLEPSEAVVPLVRRYAKSAAAAADVYFSEKTLIATALAWHGSSVGADHLSSVLTQAVAEGRHVTPPRLGVLRTSLISGGHGHDDHSIVNRLIVMAGKSGDAKKFVKPLAAVITAVPGLGVIIPKQMPYDRNRKDIISEPFYARLRNIAFAVDHIPCAALLKPMEKLLHIDGITGYDTPVGSGRSPRYMLAYLELCLAAAAAKCGSPIGIKILRRYTGDTHCFMRDYARSELASIKKR
ncbi:MAG: FAD-dependent oxidoreductase [Spirochaetes bacterium]|nr:FAD-dependent oxidoreductase [Spirochaetota bacterium]